MEKIQIDSKFADQSGEIMVVELGGHVDQSNSYQLQKMFENIIQSGCYKVIVDFKDLFYMSSAGWGVFVGEIKRFRENGGDIKLAGMNPEIYDVYQMLEFYHILEDYARVEDAAASFGKQKEELNLAIDEEDLEADEVETQAPDEIHITGDADEDEVEEEVIQIPESSPQEEEKEILEFQPDDQKEVTFGRKGLSEFVPHTLKKDVKLADLPLAEKIKRVIAQNPLLGVWGIRRVLRHEHFGRTRIGVFALWRLLKDMNLNSKAKRFRYYRSC